MPSLLGVCRSIPGRCQPRGAPGGKQPRAALLLLPAGQHMWCLRRSAATTSVWWSECSSGAFSRDVPLSSGLCCSMELCTRSPEAPSGGAQCSALTRRVQRKEGWRARTLPFRADQTAIHEYPTCRAPNTWLASPLSVFFVRLAGALHALLGLQG